VVPTQGETLARSSTRLQVNAEVGELLRHLTERAAQPVRFALGTQPSAELVAGVQAAATGQESDLVGARDVLYRVAVNAPVLGDLGAVVVRLLVRAAPMAGVVVQRHIGSSL